MRRRPTPTPSAIVAALALVVGLLVAGSAQVGGALPAGAAASASAAEAPVAARAGSVRAAVRALRTASRRLDRVQHRVRTARKHRARGGGHAARVLRRATRERARAKARVRRIERRLKRLRPVGKPNVVLFLLDDMRADELPYLPRTRSLLSSGTVMTDVVSSHPLCCPARAQIFSGQYAQNNGVRHNSGPHGYPGLDPSTSIATMLSSAGYRTALHGKYLNGYRPRTGHREPGWSTWDPLRSGVYDYRRFSFLDGDRFRDDYVTDRITERSLETVRRASDRDAPFFVMVNHPAPHFAKGDSWGGGRLRHNPPPARSNYLRQYAGTRAPYLANPAFDEPDVSDKPVDYHRSEGRWDAPYVQQQFAHRAAALRTVDDGIAATLAQLRRSGELRNTYVVVTSDNGYTLGEHRSMGKNTFYDQVLSIPMLIAGPGVRRGTTDLPAHLADLSATILDIADARVTRRLDGASFLPALRGAPGPTQAGWRDTTLLLAGALESQYADQWGFRGVRTERYTYGVSFHEPRRELLFDRRTDPHELTSVHADPAYAVVRAELQRRADLLAGCSGPSCNQQFGPLPEPGVAPEPESEPEAESQPEPESQEAVVSP